MKFRFRCAMRRIRARGGCVNGCRRFPINFLQPPGFEGLAFQRKAKIRRCLTDREYRAIKKSYTSVEEVVSTKSEIEAPASHVVQPVNMQLKTIRVWQRRTGASGESLKPEPPRFGSPRPIHAIHPVRRY